MLFIDRMTKPDQPPAALFPRAVVARCAALIGGLSLIKVWMLASYQKHLFETHWRVDAEPTGRLGWVGFGLFVALLGLHLWTLAGRCAVAGVRTVRWANGGVLLLGLFFVLLTFSEGDKNYLAPVFSGVLGWKDLSSYLFLDFFFRPPFLAFWIGGYALIYFILARSGRERWVLHVSTLGATAYTAIFLHHFNSHPHALLVADALGVAGLLGARTAQTPLRSTWLWLPMMWIGFMFGLFHKLTPELIVPDPELITLVMVACLLSAGMKVLARCRGFNAAWSWMAPFAFSAFLLLLNLNYPSAPNYNHLLCLALTWPRYFLGAFGLTACLLAAAWMWRRHRPQGTLWWLDAVNLALLLLGLVDLRLSQILGIRLDWQLFAFSNSPKMMWRMAGPYLPPVILLVLASMLLYGMAVYALQRGATKTTPSASDCNRTTWSLILGFVLLALTGFLLATPDKALGQPLTRLVISSPLWKNPADPMFSETKFEETIRHLGLDQMLAQPVPAGPRKEWNVVVIFQESSYNKYLSLFGSREDTQPLLSKYKDRMELFPGFFSNYASSIHARFATFTGLYPVRDYNAFTIEHVGVLSLFEILHQQGYHNSLFYSSFFDYTGFDDFLRGRGIDDAYDADSLPGKRKTDPISWGVQEEETLGAMRAQIRRHAERREKFFLTYVPAAPHYPYDSIPDRFRKHPLVNTGDYSPKYLNDLLYMDWVIASLLDELRDSGELDHTLVIITDDHGEMTGENGGAIGHGWAVTPELANIPLIILNPSHHGYSVNPAIGSQVDLLPTLLELLGIPLPADQLYQGRSLYRQPLPDSCEYLNSFQQFGTLNGTTLTCADRGRPAGSASGAKSFTVTTRGSTTLFESFNPPPFATPSIDLFDRFQENLLRHYSEYCVRWHQGKAAAARAEKPAQHTRR